jgi:hypothetical protein
MACASAQAGDVAPLPGTRDSGPPRFEQSCYCAQVYMPVMCRGGAVYSNACVASCAGAKDCRPGASIEPRKSSEEPYRLLEDRRTGEGRTQEVELK